MIYRQVLRRMQHPAVLELPRGAQVLLKVLLERSKRDDDGVWVARAGDAALMQRTGYRRTAVVELRRRLEDAGLVVTLEGAGLQQTRYELIDPVEVAADVPA